MQKVKILGIIGSARKDGNTAKLVKRALEGAMTVPGIETELYELAGKKIGYCVACYKCLKTGECSIKDDLQDLVKKYIDADGIIWGAPVYHLSVPGLMKSALDRLGNVVLCHFLQSGKGIPRLSKVCGVLTDAGSRNGGQEMVMSFLVNSCLCMEGVVVSGDTILGSYIGAAACSGGEDPASKDNVLKDEEGLRCAVNLGKRVAEMTRIVKTGKSALEKELPSEYFYKWEEQG
jgi:multimeric flavodoxin WrbA